MMSRAVGQQLLLLLLLFLLSCYKLAEVLNGLSQNVLSLCYWSRDRHGIANISRTGVSWCPGR